MHRSQGWIQAGWSRGFESPFLSITSCLISTMAGERRSDLGVIAVHYNERISGDDVCPAFTQTHT